MGSATWDRPHGGRRAQERCSQTGAQQPAGLPTTGPKTTSTSVLAATGSFFMSPFVPLTYSKDPGRSQRFSIVAHQSQGVLGTLWQSLGSKSTLTGILTLICLFHLVALMVQRQWWGHRQAVAQSMAVPGVMWSPSPHSYRLNKQTNKQAHFS